MKKLCYFSILAIFLCCLIGCQDKNSNSNSKLTKSDLDEIATSLYKAGNSALIQMEEEDLGIGNQAGFSISSKGSFTGIPATFEENSQTFIEYLSYYNPDCEKIEWIIFIKNGVVYEVYCAKDFNSKTVGAYKYNDFSNIELDVKGKTLKDITAELRKKETLGITVDEFIDNFNKQVPLVFPDIEASIWQLQKKDEIIDDFVNSYSYSYCKDIYDVILTEVDGYLSTVQVSTSINVKENYGDFMTKEQQNMFFDLILTPSIVLNNLKTINEIKMLRNGLYLSFNNEIAKIEKSGIEYYLSCSSLFSLLIISSTTR